MASSRRSGRPDDAARGGAGDERVRRRPGRRGRGRRRRGAAPACRCFDAAGRVQRRARFDGAARCAGSPARAGADRRLARPSRAAAGGRTVAGVVRARGGAARGALRPYPIGGRAGVRREPRSLGARRALRRAVAGAGRLRRGGAAHRAPRRRPARDGVHAPGARQRARGARRDGAGRAARRRLAAAAAARCRSRPDRRVRARAAPRVGRRPDERRPGLAARDAARARAAGARRRRARPARQRAAQRGVAARNRRGAARRRRCGSASRRAGCRPALDRSLHPGGAAGVSPQRGGARMVSPARVAMPTQARLAQWVAQMLLGGSASATVVDAPWRFRRYRDRVSVELVGTRDWQHEPPPPLALRWRGEPAIELPGWAGRLCVRPGAGSGAIDATGWPGSRSRSGRRRPARGCVCGTAVPVAR